MRRRATLLLAMPVLLCAAFARQGATPREALTLGRTHDEALYASFNKSYTLAASEAIDRAEIVTEFRRAVLLVRERASQGDYSMNEASLAKAVAPFQGIVTFIVQARLHPLNTFVREPAYDLYISTGPRSAPIAAKTLKRDPVYPPGSAPGSGVVGVRVEASFSRTDIDGAVAPHLVLTDDKAEILWQARLDLARYR